MPGLLAVAALKGTKLLLMRVRAVRVGGNSALYITNSNGDDDKVLRIAPARI